MASSGGACRSLCRRTEEDDAKGNQMQCSKCTKEDLACNGLCSDCFRSSVFGKFKLAVTSSAMISPSDKVLVAFSGGPASRVALQFLHELQRKSLKNWDASKSLGLPVFGISVVFVDESTISRNPSHLLSNIIEEIRSIVSELAPAQELHVTSIESIFLKDFDDGRKCLDELLDSITDATGKEDVIQYLRMLSLQKIALDNKYTKLLLGSCTSKMARLIISATVKGQGFALPAYLQYVDARWEVPVVFPLRDCLAQELAMICQLDGLKTAQPSNCPSAGINDLVSSFVARLQDENPSRERTIVRTGEKLRPFSFNKFTQVGYYEHLPSIIRSKFQNASLEESGPEILCPVCRSPLSDSEWKHLKEFGRKRQTEIEQFGSQCCRSCWFQILPKGEGSLERFYSLLPLPMTDGLKNKGCGGKKWLREQIEEFLINDNEDAT